MLTREKNEGFCHHFGMWREISEEMNFDGTRTITYKCIGCGLTITRTAR